MFPPSTAPVRLPPVALISLGVMLAASLWVFITLVRRQTRHRRLIDLVAWARSHSLKLVDPQSADASAMLPALAQLEPMLSMLLHGQSLTIAQLRTGELHPAAAAAQRRTEWRVLLHALPGRWPTTALRPTACAASLIDLYSLSSYPSLATDRRFMVFGVEARSAAALARSGAVSILPPDIGLLLHDQSLILDFTLRPFDEIEFSRILDIARQLIPTLGASLVPMEKQAT